MAKPIKETPALFDNDAERFLNDISSNEVDADAVDRAHKTLLSVQNNPEFKL